MPNALQHRPPGHLDVTEGPVRARANQLTLALDWTNHGLDSVPYGPALIASLRVTYPDVPLHTLGEYVNPPLTQAKVYRYMCDLALLPVPRRTRGRAKPTEPTTQAAEVCSAAAALRDAGIDLHPQLGEAVRLRLAHPDWSAARLAAACDPPIRLSLWTSRLRRLFRLAAGTTGWKWVSPR